jgi:hypothetical protein
MKTAEAYLKEAGTRDGILYYPGAGSDSGPFHLFAESEYASEIIYVDYGINENEVREFLPKLKCWTVESILCLHPDIFSRNSWADFWPANQRARDIADPTEAFAIKATLSH